MLLRSSIDVNKLPFKKLRFVKLSKYTFDKSSFACRTEFYGAECPSHLIIMSP